VKGKIEKVTVYILGQKKKRKRKEKGKEVRPALGGGGTFDCNHTLNISIKENLMNLGVESVGGIGRTRAKGTG